MDKENKDVFDSIEGVPQEELNAETTSVQDLEVPKDVDEEIEEAEDSTEEEELEIKVSTKSPQQIEEERGVKKESDGRILTIREVNIRPPKTKKVDENGITVKIPPKSPEGKPDVQYYTSKLQVRFEEDNLVEYYPGITFFLNEGKINPIPSINRGADNRVSQLFRLAAVDYLNKAHGHNFVLKTLTKNNRATNEIDGDEATKKNFEILCKGISDADFLKYLVGKKVKIEVETGDYNNKKWFRNNIKEFV